MTSKLYIGTKLINATTMTRQEYNVLRGWSVPDDENPADEGYLVEYIDGGKANHPGFSGYISWSPKDIFDSAYRSTDRMTFGDALVMLKAGKLVCRAGWNGKDMWLYIVDGASLAKAFLYGFGEYIGEPTTVDSIAMKTADNKVVVGWLASQADMLADDWMVID